MSQRIPSTGDQLASPELTTFRQRIYWAYANLAMAQGAVDLNQGIYSKFNRMQRHATYNGLTKGTRKLRSSLQDERNRLVHSERICSYCGDEGGLALDHIFPRKFGGADDAENLVTVCRTCNSSKGKKDLMEWMQLRGHFLPLTVIKRYLKLTFAYCVEHGLIDQSPEELRGLDLPFNIEYLPMDYPAPSELAQFPMTQPRTIRPERARAAVGKLQAGCKVAGKCQFSLVELIDYVLQSIGPALVAVATWNADGLDIEHMATMLKDGRIKDIRWLLPTRFPDQRKQCSELLLAHFGPERVRFGGKHGQYVLLHNQAWNLCVLTSMNLECNRGIATFEIWDDEELFDYFLEEGFKPKFGTGLSIERAVESLRQSRGTQGEFDFAD